VPDLTWLAGPILPKMSLSGSVPVLEIDEHPVPVEPIDMAWIHR
jgi:hypothetical protein